MESIVFFPTNNIGKFNRYKRFFEEKNIDYRRYLRIGDEEIKTEVKEDAKTTKENAQKKAKAYFDKYRTHLANSNFIIMTTDEALYIDGLDKEEQPGLYVRRFNGLDRASDDEVVERYTKFVKKMGGEVKAKWVYSMVIYDGKSFYDYSWDEKVLFSDTPHYPITKGYVLNNITIVKKEDGKNIMLSDLSDEESYRYLSKYIDKVVDFVDDKIKRNKK